MSARSAEYERPTKTAHSNVVLWLAFGSCVVATEAFFLLGLHPHLGYDALLAVVALVGRTVLFVAVGLTLEALLLRAHDGYFALTKTRRSVLHAYWVCVMFLGVALIVDTLLFAFAGYHLPTAARILFSDGPAGVGQVVQATGLSLKLVLVTFLGVIGAVAIAIALSKWSRRWSSRWNVLVTRRKAVQAVFVTIGALALLDLGAARVRNPFLWERELGRIPLAFSFVRPRAELASLRAKLRPFADQARSRETNRGARAPDRPDIVIVLVESLRADVVTPEVMPRFSEYAETAWTFEHTITAGNVTHFAWYGLLASRLPVYYSAAKALPQSRGSLALARLVDAGYRIHVLATPDLQYQHLEPLLFGTRDSAGNVPLMQAHFQPTTGTVAERDAEVVKEFERQLGTNTRGGHVYLVALDSSHYEYAWGSDFVPKFVPYARAIPITHDYHHDSHARRLVINRYRNAVAWIDRLLGRLLDTITSTARSGHCIVVIAGDHGEAFWEHETATHGSRLTRDQLEVGFAMSLPNRGARHTPGVLSTLDVMPTILAELGLDATELDGIAVGSHDALPGALTFQGWNEQAYHFALTLHSRRLLFQLDQEDPRAAKQLVLSDVTDLSDVSLVGREGGVVDNSYSEVVQGLPGLLDRLPFLQL